MTTTIKNILYTELRKKKTKLSNLEYQSDRLKKEIEELEQKIKEL